MNTNLPTIDLLRQEIENYASIYFDDDPPQFHEERCDLAECWRQNTTLQNAEKSGCYFLFNELDELLYVRKASMRGSIGARVVSHFIWRDDKLSLRSNLSAATAFYLRTVTVANPWEAPSLEEYLIAKLNPPLNKAGRSLAS